MKRLLGLSALALVMVVGGWSVGQDTKEKGYLPANYAKLGLSDEQKQKVYKIQADYKTKVEAIEKQLATLKTEQRTALEGVLTPAQKSKLREILLGTLDK
jgi:hypothetical protein